MKKNKNGEEKEGWVGRGETRAAFYKIWDVFGPFSSLSRDFFEDFLSALRVDFGAS